MLPSYFDYIFMLLRQKARLRPELSRNFCQLYARSRPEKPGSTYNFAALVHSALNVKLINRFGYAQVQIGNQRRLCLPF